MGNTPTWQCSAATWRPCCGPWAFAFAPLQAPLGVYHRAACSNSLSRSEKQVTTYRRLGEHRGTLLTSKHENSVAYDTNLSYIAATEKPCTVVAIPAVQHDFPDMGGVEPVKVDIPQPAGLAGEVFPAACAAAKAARPRVQSERSHVDTGYDNLRNIKEGFYGTDHFASVSIIALRAPTACPGRRSRSPRTGPRPRSPSDTPPPGHKRHKPDFAVTALDLKAGRLTINGDRPLCLAFKSIYKSHSQLVSPVKYFRLMASTMTSTVQGFSVAAI